MHDKIQMREWSRLTWHDPEEKLRKLRDVEFKVLDLDLPPDVRHLRTNELKPWNEARQAALFAHGMREVLGTKVFLALHEAADYDFVAHYREGDAGHFCPVQLKEWVPPERNPEESLNDLLAKIARKYPTPTTTTVAIHVNNPGRLEFAGIEVPEISLGGLWLFGSKTTDQSRWWLYGSLIHHPDLYEFRYPWP
ncbi:MAG: hypothetical protein ACQGVC_05770 [Myxococcota bacterium]